MRYKFQNIDRRDYYGSKFLVEYWNDLSARIGSSAYLVSAELDKFGKKTPISKVIYTLEVLDLDKAKGIAEELGNWELVKVIEKKRRV